MDCDLMLLNFWREGTSQLVRFIKEGSYTHNARTDADFTITLPNHTSMITGRCEW